jgi:MFS family permease
MVGDVGDGLRWVRERRPLAVIIGLMVVTGLFMVGPHQTLQPLIVRDHLGAGSVGYGLTATAMSVGTLSTSLMLTSMGGMRNKGGFFAMALIGGSAGFLGYAFSPTFGVALVFFFVWGGFGGFFVNMSQSLLQSHTPDHMMGRVMALNTVAMQGFMPVGALQAGLLATAIGPQSAALFSTVTCASLATLALVTVPSFRRLS